MPKHMTGDEFIELMEVKQKEKDEEEAAKKRRKIEREEKKIIKQAMKEEKAKVRELKRLLTAEKREKEATIRMEKKKAREMKKRAFRPPLKQLESCVQCGAVENNECDEQWVACDNCERWWHVHCTDTPTMSAQEFNLIMWNCINSRVH